MDCFKSTGKQITETRFPGEFKEIQVNDKMEVLVQYGAEYQVAVNAGENIIGNVKTWVENGTLKIDNKNTCNFVRGYKRKITVTVSLPYLRKLEHLGVGPVTINLSQDSLFVRAENSGEIYINGNFDQVRTSSHGNGDVYLSGNSNSLMAYCFGTNYLKAKKMLVKNYVYISTYSVGDAELNLSDQAGLDYLIWKDGNIYYSGNPQAIRNLSEKQAKGRLIADSHQ